MSVELANVTEDSNKFDVDDLQSVTDKLSSIVEFASNQNLTEETIVKVNIHFNSEYPSIKTKNGQQTNKNRNVIGQDCLNLRRYMSY